MLKLVFLYACGTLKESKETKTSIKFQFCEEIFEKKCENCLVEYCFKEGTLGEKTGKKDLATEKNWKNWVS